MRMAFYVRRKVLILVGIFTTLGQLAGLTTPWWVVIKSGDHRMVHGLWYSLQCEVASGISYCDSLTHVADSIFGSTRVGYGLESLVGCIMTILATVFLVLYDSRDNTYKTVATGVLSSVLYIVSGVLTWVAVGSVCSENVKFREIYETDVPWSLIVSAITGSVPFLLAVAVGFKVCNNYEIIRREQLQKQKTKEFYEQQSCNSSMNMLNSSSLHSSMHSLNFVFAADTPRHEMSSLNSIEMSDDMSKSPVFPAETIAYDFGKEPP